MKSLLVPYGCLLTLFLIGAALVPYFRGRAHLFTSWNLFLLGMANFIGVATVQSGLVEEHTYGYYETSDYVRFMLGGVTFVATAMLTYRFVKFPARLATRRLQKWMLPSRFGLICLALFASVFTIGTIATPNVQFIGQIAVSAGWYGSSLAAMLAFIAWYRQRSNLPLMLLSVFTFLAALVFLLATTFSRRDYLNLILVVPIGTYWSLLRYRHPMRMMPILGAAAGVGFVIIAGVSAIRFARGEKGSPVDIMFGLPANAMAADTGGLIGGDTTEASLLAVHRYTKDAPPYPFFSVIYVVSNPIPRAWYPEKVGSLAEELPRDTGWWSRNGYVNWGPGIVGHGFHEGGLHMLVFYGFVLAVGFKFFVQLLIRQHGNVLLWGIFASVSGQVFALPRGELGLFTVTILGGVFGGLFLNAIGRRIFGTIDYRFVDPADPAAASAVPGTGDAGDWFPADTGSVTPTYAARA